MLVCYVLPVTLYLFYSYIRASIQLFEVRVNFHP